MDTNVIITFFACLILIFLIGKIFIIPLKKILKVMVNSLLGGCLIYIINLVGATFGFHIGLNVITAVIVRNIRYTGNYIISFIKDFIMREKYRHYSLQINVKSSAYLKFIQL